MKEILFVLEDGSIVGLTFLGVTFVWAIIGWVLASLGVLLIVRADGSMSHDEWIGVLVGIPIVVALVMAAIHWWKGSLIILATLLFLVGLPVAAYKIGEYLHSRR